MSWKDRSSGSHKAFDTSLRKLQASSAWKNKRNTFECPSCGKKISKGKLKSHTADPDTNLRWMPYQHGDPAMKQSTDDDVPLADKSFKRFDLFTTHCPHCKAQLGIYNEETRMTFKGYLEEAKKPKKMPTKPIGNCYQYAYQKGKKLCHGMVTDPKHGFEYDHAWAEDGDMVYDWQTMEARMGKYAGKGWPKDEFYKTFKPKEVKTYDWVQAAKMGLKTGHYGPWHKVIDVDIGKIFMSVMKKKKLDESWRDDKTYGIEATSNREDVTRHIKKYMKPQSSENDKTGVVKHYWYDLTLAEANHLTDSLKKNYWGLDIRWGRAIPHTGMWRFGETEEHR